MLWKAFLYTALFVGVFCENLQLDDMYKQHIHQYVEATCTKNNAKDKAPQVEAAIYSFKDCIYEHKDPDIIKDVDKLDEQQGAITVYKRVCKKVPEFKICFYKLVDEAAVCGPKNATTEITEAKKFFDELLEYLCGNNAERFVNFVNDESLQCIEEKKTSLEQCIEKAFIDLGSGEDSSSEPEVCSTFDDLKQCIHTTLKECPKQTTSEFFDGIFGLLRKASRCNLTKLVTWYRLYDEGAAQLRRNT